MKEIRKEIDKIDEKIINLLEKRRLISIKVAKYKKENNIEIVRKDREEEIMKKLENVAKTKNIPVDFLKKIFQEIIKDSINMQNNFLKINDK